ncbi:MAG: protease modulator HflC [Sphingomonas sp.]|uniref:protease modulator HflC n=1 Tax=unclassified Sphingomonas TaxID=196159 RepID=UPI002454E6ED|nr:MULTISPECIES: protease modulator HflC [unclassified Sphingomonas]MBQ1498257.1 protease modulator HflC [Sphingomonas sp.]MDH4742836.1 protease modulator HflC [Sphingomonas sp. CBMAI 2297]
MTWLRSPIGIAVALIVAVIVVMSTVAIVPETKQAVILRLEQPQRVVNAWRSGETFGRTNAGPIFRIPFVDRIVWVDKRVLSVDLPNEPVLSTDQLRLQIDAYARFRVTDPLKMVVSIGTEERARDQLQPLFRSALRNELGKRPSAVLLSPERGQVMDNIQGALQQLAAQYGVSIVDVRIKQTELPSGSPLDSAFERMKTARYQEAKTIEAQGMKDAQIIRANADAQAAQIYAQAFNKDPEFYDFWRAMRSYRTTFLNTDPAKGDTSIILSPNNSYLKEFMGQR